MLSSRIIAGVIASSIRDLIAGLYDWYKDWKAARTARRLRNAENEIHMRDAKDLAEEFYSNAKKKDKKARDFVIWLDREKKRRG